MPATIGISAASATSCAIESSKMPITREAMNAVTRFTASHAQRFLKLSSTGANRSSSCAQAGLGELRLGAALADVVDHRVHRQPADQPAGGVDHRRGDQVVALERARRVLRARPADEA